MHAATDGCIRTFRSPDTNNSNTMITDTAIIKNRKNKRVPKHPSCHVARPERFELPTPKFVAWCSIQLSYGRKKQKRNCAEPGRLRQC